MSAKILSGIVIRDEHLPILKEKFSAMSTKPILTIIEVGNRPDTASFIRAKRSFAEKVGIEVRVISLKQDTKNAEIISLIKKENDDAIVGGIIVQLPLPEHLDKFAIIESIDPGKDVDALTSINVKKWLENIHDSILPATARGVRTMLHFYKINLEGKKVAVIGRSNLVGKPVAQMCQNENATVTVCHSKTVNLNQEILNADIVISATGKIGLLNRDNVRAGQIIIDVGINTMSDQKLELEGKRKIVGDAKFDEVSEIVNAISPVPGGVGPLTVLSLFENLYDLNRVK